MERQKYKCPTCGKFYSFQAFTCCGVKPKRNDPKKYVADEKVYLIDWEKELLPNTKQHGTK